MTSQKTYPYEDATDRARGVADVTSDRLKDAGDKAQQMAYDMAEQTRQYGQKAQDAARQFKPFVERSIERPAHGDTRGGRPDWLRPGGALEEINRHGESEP